MNPKTIIKDHLAAGHGRKLYSAKQPDAKGLYLRVQPSGAAAWIYRVDNQQHKLGDFPDLTLAKAKDARLSKVIELRDAPETSDEFVTVQQLVDAYVDFISTRVADWRRQQSAFKRQLLDTQASVHPSKVSTAVLDYLNDRPAARRELQMFCRQCWEWGLNTGRITGGNPWALLKRQRKAKPRTRKLKGAQLKAFVNALAAKPHTPTWDVVRLVLLTGCRRNEVIKAPVHEFDVEHGRWTIDAERMKAGLEHEVILSRQALTVIERCLARDGDYLFTSERTGRPLSDVHVAAELRALIAELDLPQTTLHDLRRTLATWAAEQQCPMQVIKRMLAHTPDDVTSAVYAQAQLTPDAADWWQRWGDHLAQLQAKPVLKAV